METVGIRELKAHLSGYLRRVAQGERILVTDHGHVIAELGPPSEAGEMSSAALRYQQAVDAGVVRPALNPSSRAWLDLPPVGAEPGLAQRLIDADRGD